MKNHSLSTVDAIITVRKIIDIANAEFLTEDQKAQNICRIVFSFVGEGIGEAVFPLPGVGGYIGKVAGAIVGDVVHLCTFHVIPSVFKFIASFF